MYKRYKKLWPFLSYPKIKISKFQSKKSHCQSINIPHKSKITKTTEKVINGNQYSVGNEIPIINQ